MKKLLIAFFLSLNITGCLVLASGPIFAQEGGAADEVETAQSACPTGSGGGFLGIPTWYKYLTKTETIAGRCSPVVTFPDDITKILLAVFEIIIRVAGLAAVLFVIWGAFQYQTSQGDPDKTKNARSTIINALIGLAISVSAVAGVNLIARGLT